MVQPLIAKVWAQRRKDYIVIAANEDFIPGMVSFSVRAGANQDLRQLVLKLRDVSDEFSYKYSAIEGIFSKYDFTRLLRDLGFESGLKASA